MQKNYGISKEDVVLALDSKNPVSSIYEQISNTEDGQSILDKLSTSIDEQTLIANKITIVDLIKNLPEKEKQVILLRYYKNKTQSEVAKILGTTQVQISRIEKRVLESMKKKLTQDVVLT